MLFVCQICLSTDKKLQAVDESLYNFHQELCDFNVTYDAEYCVECAYLLKKCYNFKQKCVRANIILMKWKTLPKASLNKEQLQKLKEELPPSPLGLSKDKNRKIECISHVDYDLNPSIHSIYTGLHQKSVNNIKNVIAIVPKHTDTADVKSKVKVEIDDDDDPLQISNQNSHIKIVSKRVNNEEGVEKELPKRVSKRNVVNKVATMSITEVGVKKELPKRVSKRNEAKKIAMSKVKVGVGKELPITDVKREIKSVDEKMLESNERLSESQNDTEIYLDEEYLDYTDAFEDESTEIGGESECENIKDNDDDDNEYYIERLSEDSFSEDENFNNPKRTDNINETPNETEHSSLLVEIKDEHPDSDSNPITDKCKPKRVNNSKDDLKDLIDNITRKFKNKVVKDENGYVIDKNCILNSLEKMNKKTYATVKRHCSVPGPFTPEALKLLSQIQRRSGYDYTEVFITELLNTEEEMIEKFKERKNNEIYLNSVNNCTLCYKSFRFKKMLDYHLAEHHNPALNIVCKICAMRFKTVKTLKSHMMKHGTVYRCKICPLVTNDRQTMENHYNLHMGVSHVCKKCGTSFRHYSSLAVHMNDAHKSESIVCPFCARNFHSRIGLLGHKSKKHLDEQILEDQAAKCDLCDVTFVSWDVLKIHEYNCHTNDKMRKRRILYKPPGYVPRKRRKPDEDKETFEYNCSLCGVVKDNVGSLMSHFNTSHPGSRVEYSSRRVNKYLCHECGKTFFNLNLLREHQDLHTGAKPYACDQCSKAFQSKMKLKNHLKFHNSLSQE